MKMRDRRLTWRFVNFRIRMLGILTGLFMGFGEPASGIGVVEVDSVWQNGFCMIVMSPRGRAEFRQTRDSIVALGGSVAILAPPDMMLGWIPRQVEKEITGRMGILAIIRDTVDLSKKPGRTNENRAVAGFFNYVKSGRSLACGRVASGRRSTATPLNQCVRSAREMSPAGLDPGPWDKNYTLPLYGTSEFMTGTVAVALFYVESNGIIDPDLYTWNTTDETSVFNQALSGLSWWASQAPVYGENVSFEVITYLSANPACSQSYEPINNHLSVEANLWINAIMDNLDIPSGPFLSRVNAFNEGLRSNYGTDWAYSVFIGYNPGNAPTAFTDGYFAYVPQAGGPLVQMLFRNDGWGESSFGLVLTHETGHIFWACDEYYQPNYGGCTQCLECINAPGRTIPNSNCQQCNPASVPCMMRWNESSLCLQTPLQVGWQMRTWVDFSYTGLQNGSFNRPYDTFNEGVTNVQRGRILWIKSGQSHEPATFPVILTNPMTIKSWNGGAVIGY